MTLIKILASLAILGLILFQVSIKSPEHLPQLIMVFGLAIALVLAFTGAGYYMKKREQAAEEIRKASFTGSQGSGPNKDS